nr:odorant receptor coreceptor-like [Onthophagus taurus]
MSCMWVWLYQTIQIILCCLIITAGDITFFSYLMYVTANVKALQEHFKDIRRIAKDKLKHTFSAIHDDLNDDDLYSSPGLIFVMEDEMKNCSKHLQWLIKKVEDVEDIYNFPILLQMLCALFTLMSCLYVATSVEIFSTPFLVEAEKYFIFTLQVAMYCLIGNKVEVAFSEIPNAIYHTSWYSVNNSFKKSMIINMIRLNKPIGLTVGKFTVLSLALLVKVNI